MTAAVAAGIGLSLSGCLAMWTGNEMHHREGSGFASLGRSPEEWTADWNRMTARYGFDADAIAAALQARGASCGLTRNPPGLVKDRQGRDKLSYACGYVFCRSGYYQSYNWTFPKRDLSAGDDERLYFDNNTGRAPECDRGAGRDRKLLELQRALTCPALEGGNCAGSLPGRRSDTEGAHGL